MAGGRASRSWLQVMFTLLQDAPYRNRAIARDGSVGRIVWACAAGARRLLVEWSLAGKNGSI